MGLGGGAEVLARGDVHARMTIKLKRQVGKDTIKGQVKASDRACVGGRKVRLVVRKPNQTRRRVATPRTNGKGRWKFVPKPGSTGYTGEGGYSGEGVDTGGGRKNRYADPGEYHAKVREIHVGGVTCAANKTSPIHVG